MEIQGFHGSLEELLNSFSVSRRFAMRVGALLKFGVSISPTVLEAAVPGSELEAFLLKPALLKRAQDLSTEVLKELWEEGDCPLVVWRRGGERVLLLEEELLALEGFEGEKESRGQEESMLTWSLALGENSKQPAIRKEVFLPEEVERWKLDLLTTADPVRKCETLRRIGLAPLSPQEKALLCLHTLKDPHAEVRKEVATLLAGLGISPEVTENMRLASGSPHQRSYALERLCHYLDEASPLECVISFHFLESLLEEEELPVNVRWICRALKKAAQKVATPELLFQLAERLIRLLPKNLGFYGPLFSALLKELAPLLSREEYATFLERQMSMSEDPAIVAFLALLMHELSLGRQELLATKLAHLLAESSESDRDRYRIGKSLVELGDVSIEPLIEVYPQASEGNRRYLLQLLDHIATALEEEVEKKRRVVLFFLSVLEEASPALRMGIFEFQIWKSPLSPEDKKTVAQAFCQYLGSWNTTSLQANMELVFENLGEEAIPFLEEVLETALEEQVIERAVGYLVHAVRKAESVETVCLIWDKLEGLWGKPLVRKSTLIQAMAYLAGAEELPFELVKEYSRQLLEMYSEGEGELDGAILTGLGHLAHVSFQEEKLAAEVLEVLLRELERAEEKGREIEKELEEDANEEEERWFSDLLPRLLDALKEWGSSEKAAPEARWKVYETLLEKWKKVKSWQILWGPYNEAKLAQNLVELAGAVVTEPEWKARLLRAVKSHSDRMYVLQSLERVMDENRHLEALGEVAAEILRFLLRKKRKLGKFPEETRAPIYRLMGVLAGHHYLGGEKYPAPALQNLTYPILVEGIGQHIPGMDRYLEKMTESKRMPEDLREKILQRLKTLRMLRHVGEEL